MSKYKYKGVILKINKKSIGKGVVRIMVQDAPYEVVAFSPLAEVIASNFEEGQIIEFNANENTREYQGSSYTELKMIAIKGKETARDYYTRPTLEKLEELNKHLAAGEYPLFTELKGNDAYWVIEWLKNSDLEPTGEKVLYCGKRLDKCRRKEISKEATLATLNRLFGRHPKLYQTIQSLKLEPALAVSATPTVEDNELL